MAEKSGVERTRNRYLRDFMLIAAPISCHAKSAYVSQGLWRGLQRSAWNQNSRKFVLPKRLLSRTRRASSGCFLLQAIRGYALFTPRGQRTVATGHSTKVLIGELAGLDDPPG